MSRTLSYLWWCVLAVCISSQSCNGDSWPCTTSNNVSGVCVPVFQCQELYNIYTKRNATDEDKWLLQSAYCASKGSLREPRVCCDEVTVSKTLEENKKKQCGETPLCTSTLKVVGGKKSALGAWPWMAALYNRKSPTDEIGFACSGSLIADNWVLTAAHCVPTLWRVELHHVRLGDLDLNQTVDDEANPIEVKIQNVIQHPNFTRNTRVALNDIALVELEERVVFTDHIRPICLHKGKEYATNERIYDQKLPTIAGWGNTADGNHTTTHLMEVSLKTLPLETCKKIYYFKVDNSVLCCKTPKKDACQGDSGGPLMFIEKDSTWSQGGIVSFGYKCATDDYAGVYTKVAPFIEWIENETGLIF